VRQSPRLRFSVTVPLRVNSPQQWRPACFRSMLPVLRRAVLVLVFMFLAGAVWGQDFIWDEDTNDGDWNTTTNWSPSGTPGAGDTVEILPTTNGPPTTNIPTEIAGLTLSTDWNTATLTTISGPLDNSAQLTLTTILTVTGAVTNSGTIAVDGNTFTATGGGITSTGTVTTESGTIDANGSIDTLTVTTGATIDGD